VANLGAINADVGHIDTITSPNGPIVVSAAAFESDEAALDMIVGGFEVNDQSANFVASLGAFDADVSHVQSISFADSLPPTLNLTAAQASADAILLAKVVSPYILNVANADGSTTTTGFGQGLTFAAVASGNDTIAATNGGATTGAVSFGSGISDEDLWFQQVGDNLQIDVMGTSHSLTINDWFRGTNPAAVQGFIAGGLTLDKQVSHLVQAMATYAANDSSFNPSAISQAPNDKTLQSAIAAAWHH
jgi:hypothetical protein